MDPNRLTMKSDDKDTYFTQNNAPTIQAVIWVMGIVTLIFGGLRLYVRSVLRKVFGWDDYMIIIALICHTAFVGVCQAAVFFGLGRHLGRTRQELQNIPLIGLLCAITETMAVMACTLGKTSFAVTLLRIVVHRWMIVLLWFVIVTMNLVNILAAIFTFFQCNDPRHLWRPDIQSSCWPADVFVNFARFVGAYSGAQDFLLVLLSWKILWNLQMKKKEKIGAGVAMSLGVFAGAAAIVKTTYLWTLSKRSDPAWELAPLFIWAVVENGLSIIAACIPTLKPALIWIFPGSLPAESYNRINHPSISNKRKVFDNSPGETLTDIRHVVSPVRESHSGSTKARSSTKSTEMINLTTEVSITYDRST